MPAAVLLLLLLLSRGRKSCSSSCDAEYKKLLLGNDSKALDDLASSALKSESDSS